MEVKIWYVRQERKRRDGGHFSIVEWRYRSEHGGMPIVTPYLTLFLDSYELYWAII